ncbi:MAG: HAD hydrolase-like protein, partial [Clostridiales bacterium]|nr:HAD hydrolase-like protein [Clostridiales bacterium]
HLIKQYNIDPELACMIGDRPLDVQAGQNAGMLSCLLDTEGRFAGEPCDIRAASAEGLAGMLRPDRIKPIESV